MDFSLTAEQETLIKVIAKFAKNELLPDYMKWDREEKFPRKHWNKMVEMGLPGMTIPEEYGGMAVDCVTAGLVVEELGKGDFNCSLAVISQLLAAEILNKSASEKIKAEWLPRIANGEKIVALAITEPHCGTDAVALKTRAEKKGRVYVLNGEKSGISWTFADATLVFAKTNPEAGARGVSAFLVPMNLPGITVQKYKDLGSKPVTRGSIFLEDVEVPAENLVGAEGEGFIQVMKGFEFSRILLGLGCLGAAQITLEETIKYVKERHAFGKPLAKFEGVSFPITEHLSKLEAVRWLSYRALWLKDQGLPHGKEAAMVKWMGPQYSVEAIHDCLILHGHYGYTQEYPVEQRLRDVMGMELGDGTANACKIVIVRDVFGREFLPY
ncbi:acyl-CoA dehydrogenase family protein [Desulfallas sp. Bu1-1]|uniref:acyl-CoA dehydrogenase family protein n=1 Tax=Desulfallas sp. Bu1-1 TaxID=2787620 RepID=UPI00189E5D8B|nr:acyl-CoA dehydrogenase family protein [Desulfallas sp. Bu1-1]MBF7084315.1 acyl-CoA dehydrogenase family protein [Desulfallas sp. Bu1-1]